MLSENQIDDIDILVDREIGKAKRYGLSYDRWEKIRLELAVMLDENRKATERLKKAHKGE